VGMPIHNVEMVPGKGGQICRSAGCVATIVNKQAEHAIVRLPSGELARPPQAELHKISLLLCLAVGLAGPIGTWHAV